MKDLFYQIVCLFVLAIPVACISWTVTHEEVFREFREFCVKGSIKGKSLFVRKFWYLFTCEYCFSFYIAALILYISECRLLYEDWRGYFISWFSLIWVANTYMNFHGFIRIDMKKIRLETKLDERDLKK